MTQTKAELLQTRHQGDIRLGDADSTHYVGFKAPATVGTSLVWTLPATDGTAGYYLKTDGSGNLGWSLDNSGVSLSGSTNNTIATVTGANALQGEANLTFANSGSDPILTVTNSGHAQLQLTSTGGTDNCSINFGDNDDTDVGEILYNHANNHMRFYVNGAEAIEIESDGKVGIGTTSPTSLLHLKSNAPYITFEDDDNNQDWLIQATAWLAIRDETNSAERMRLDASGHFLVGHTASEAMYYTGRIQVQGTNSTTSAITIKTNQADSGGPALVLGKSRGALGSATVVQSGDSLGHIFFNGADGTDTVSYGAEIRCQVDGTPGSNDMPGRLTFFTTADGAATATERLRISSTGVSKFTGGVSQAATAMGALDLDLRTSNYFTKTISGNSTFTFSNPAASGTVTAFTLELTHSSGTVTWPASVKWNEDTAPTLTTGKTHLFMFVTDDGGTRYRGSALVDYVN